MFLSVGLKYFCPNLKDFYLGKEKKYQNKNNLYINICFYQTDACIKDSRSSKNELHILLKYVVVVKKRKMKHVTNF